MKAKRLISILIALTLLCVPVSAYAAPAGSAGDPLVSRSYVDTTYPSIVLNDPYTKVLEAMRVLEYKLSQTVGDAAATVCFGAGAGSTSNMKTGGNIVLFRGAATITSCTGKVIDVTAGQALGAGQSLTPNHKYVAGENTSAVLSFSAQSYLSLFGDVTLTGGSGGGFTDVPSDAWYHDDVYIAVDRGLINGRSATIYAPDENLMASEAIKLAACMNQLYNKGSVTLQNGSDVWYSTYVDYALQNGIISEPFADYSAPVDRRTFIEIFYNSMPVMAYTAINSVADGAIPDVPMSDSAAQQIYTFYRAGILIGTDAAGHCSPDKTIQRSEVAAILTRMFDATTRKSIRLP